MRFEEENEHRLKPTFDPKQDADDADIADNAEKTGLIRVVCVIRVVRVPSSGYGTGGGPASGGMGTPSGTCRRSAQVTHWRTSFHR